jgi:hypothetical protein
MDDPIDPENTLLRGFRRIHADDSSPPGEYIEPYGFVIPKGRCLIVTDLAFFSAFTNPEAAGNLTRLVLGFLHVLQDGWSQGVIFVTTPIFSQNGSIGGNVTMRSGFVIPHGRYLTVDLFDSELVETEVFVYGYLADLDV